MPSESSGGPGADGLSQGRTVEELALRGVPAELVVAVVKAEGVVEVTTDDDPKKKC